MLVHSFSIDGFLHLVEVFEAQGADKVVLRKVVRGKWVEILRSEFTPCATHAGDLLRELARLATERNERKAEQAPCGSREFEVEGERWRIVLSVAGVPSLLGVLATRDYPVAMSAPAAPHPAVLACEFAALGREQGRTEAMREKVNILPGAKAIIEWKDARIAAIEDERDRARDDARDTFRDLNAARERIATLERDCGTWRDGCAVDQRDLAAARARIAELDQREEDSRAEVADLSRRLEAQKTRADMAEAATQSIENEACGTQP